MASYSVTPKTGPRMRAIADADWLTPRISPCFSGSLRREMSAWADGVRKAKPVTDGIRLSSARPSSGQKWSPGGFHGPAASQLTTARLHTPRPISTMPIAMNAVSLSLRARRRYSTPWSKARTKPTKAKT